MVPDGAFPRRLPGPGRGCGRGRRTGEIPASTPRHRTPPALPRRPRGAATFGLQLDVTGPPGSGSWGSTTEFYGFFPDGAYLYFPSRNEVGAHLLDPSGHKAYEGRDEVVESTMRLYDASNGATNTSDFSATPDRHELKFYGKTFTWISDTSGLRANPPAG